MNINFIRYVFFVQKALEMTVGRLEIRIIQRVEFPANVSSPVPYREDTFRQGRCENRGSLLLAAPGCHSFGATCSTFERLASEVGRGRREQ